MMRSYRLFILALFSISVCSYASAQTLIDHDNWDRRDIYFKESLESIIFPPNPRWKDLSSYPQTSNYRTAASPVGRLKIWKSRGIALCTGFLVGNGLVMTNNHCISDDGTAIQAIIEMGYLSRSGRLKTYSVNTTPILTNRSKDVSLLSVDGHPAIDWGKVEFSPRELATGEDLFIIHHPGGQPMKISLDGCKAGPKRDVGQGRFLHQCDTGEGSSGSPIFDKAGRVVGIHHRGTPDRGSDAYNQGTEFVAAIEFLELIDSNADPLTQPPNPSSELDDNSCEVEVNGVVLFDPRCLNSSHDNRIEL